MKKAGLIAGGVVVVVGAVFAVGLLVGHWFGTSGQPAMTTSTTLAWSRVALPVAEAGGPMVPLGESADWMAGQEDLNDARQELADAQAALDAAAEAVADPYGMPEVWQGAWCFTRLGVLKNAADLRGLTTPQANDGQGWHQWAHEHPGAFIIVCGDVVGTQGAYVDPTYKRLLGQLIRDNELRDEGAAVAGARDRLDAALRRLDEIGRDYEQAEARVHIAVEEAATEWGPGAERTIRSALADAEWVYCDLNPGAFEAAAVSLGLLPEDPSDDLVTYWWVTRPDEYIRACKAAYALR
jgi:hypothetical protein